ncbi:hypothetical protein [Lactococcus sp. DD01]|uniref:hypothetical protein n=1 Tax=Lactococcus sp. DD01 TaxID=1776443 RepID=UPI0007761907|nr:hypothetical protein [Lactococcus sp. DD01]
MDDVSLRRAKKLYWTLWALSLLLALSVMVYLLTFRWMMYPLLALISLMFATFSLSRVVEYVVLSRVYKNNTTDFTVPRPFQKNNKSINPNNTKGKITWFFSTVPFIFLSLFIAIFDIVLFFI